MSEYRPPESDKVWTPGVHNFEPTPTPVPEPIDPVGGLVKSWSASILDKFETCPYLVFLLRVKKLEDAGNEASNRGQAVHNLAEEFIKGTIEEIPAELQKHAPVYYKLREKFSGGTVSLEHEWGFDINWMPTGWTAPNTWARMKLDVFVLEDKTSAEIIDHKTGRKFGNELKHNKQGRIYAVGAFNRYPDLEFIKTKFVYVDKNEDPLTNSYTRKQLPIIQNTVTQRAIKLTSAQDFPPRPSASNCKFCPFNDQHCEWSYYKL